MALPVAVAVLIVVWLFFVATVLFGVEAPGSVTLGMTALGLVTGIALFFWFNRHSRSL